MELFRDLGHTSLNRKKFWKSGNTFLKFWEKSKPLLNISSVIRTKNLESYKPITFTLYSLIIYPLQKPTDLKQLSGLNIFSLLLHFGNEYKIKFSRGW